MDITETTHVSLCSGYGGIDLGLRRVIPNLRTIAYAEIEAFACENLLARMEGGQLDAAPIWSNLKSFPWAEFSGLVDVLSGGYPCQPFSAAGKRAGADDPRHLWPFISSGIQILRPRLCFFENVEGHISLGLREVIADLESLGYETAWGIFSAAECGAPHQRKRVFIMAVASGFRSEAGLSRSLTGHEGITGVTHYCGTQDIWPARPGQPQHAWEPPRVVGNSECIRRAATSGNNGGVEDQKCQEEGAESKSWDTAQAVNSAGYRAEEPPRVVANSKSQRTNSGQQLCGEEWGQGRALPCEPDESNESVGNARGDGWREDQSRRETEGRTIVDGTSEAIIKRQTQPTLGGDTDGSASGLDYAELSVSYDNRTDELRLLGNGVVPATAALAFRTLLDELQRG